MRLCVLTSVWPTRHPDSGIANNLACQAGALAALGHHVQVLFLSDHIIAGKPALAFTDCGVDVHEIPTARWGFLSELRQRVLAPFLARRALRDIDANLDGIVTTSYEFPGLAYTLFTRGVPTLTRVSTTMQTVGRLTRRTRQLRVAIPAWLESVAVRSSPLLCSHTATHIELCAQEMGIRASRFILIPHGIALPEELYVVAPTEPKTILFVGRLGVRKGTDVLLAAAATVIRAHPDCRFELIGSDNESLASAFFARHPDCRDRVVFRGALDNAQRDAALSRCYMFVSPSPYESFGLTFLEAMKYGKPVIGCSGSGAAEVIGDAGLVVPPGDSDMLAASILALLTDRTRRDELASAAIERVREFSIERTARQIVEVFANSKQLQ